MTGYAKALVAALIAGLAALAAALEDNAVSAQEWVTATVALLTALGAVWAVPNRSVAEGDGDSWTSSSTAGSITRATVERGE